MARHADTCVSWPCSIPQRSSSRSHLRHDKEALSHDSWQADAVLRKGESPKGVAQGGRGLARRGGLKKPAESSPNDATVSATNGGK